MVKTFEKSFTSKSNIKLGVKNNIKADVIILGCSLPGIVTAHKLKKRFGDTMDIVVLDLAAAAASPSKGNVVFQEEGDDVNVKHKVKEVIFADSPQAIDNVAMFYLTKYAQDINIPLPDAIINPLKNQTARHKVFQYRNGNFVDANGGYHEFDYLSYMEKFELTQYQSLLDQSMKHLFHNHNPNNYSEKKKLLYYDHTTMEKHICEAILLPTPREIMRTTVRLVCGASPDQVSVLFYLHQCYRTSSCKNHLGGHNTRFREKLLGHCRKLLASKLQKSIADITMSVLPIKEIRTYSNEQVILETLVGEDNYVCNLLAMALRPDQLLKIKVEAQLLSDKEFTIATSMTPGRAKKFLMQYAENFWSREGYSGDILSIRGPILWAIERPQLSSTEASDRQAGLIGYLRVANKDGDSRDAVVEQLVQLFGDEAAEPISYRETDIPDVYIPRRGDYVGLRSLTVQESPRFVEWGALDVFADGDVAAALEAGHMTYVRLMSNLRPQAETYEDACTVDWPTRLCEEPFSYWFANVNIATSVRLVMYTTALFVGIRLLRSYIRK